MSLPFCYPNLNYPPFPSDKAFRNGQKIVSRIGDIKLEAGDVLLLDAGPSFVQTYKNNRIFALVAELDNSTPPQFQKVWIAGLAACTMIILASADLVHLVIGGLFASMIMIVTGVISVPQVGVTTIIEMR